MTNCPVCGKPVDPLRAPAVGVRDGQVISYCSKDCAALAESGPAKLIPTRTLRLPSSDERGSTELRAASVTPASGVVTVAKRPDSAPIVTVEPGDERPPPVIVARPRHKRADSSVQIADTGRLDDYVTLEPRRRAPLVAGLVLVVVAGGTAAYFLYFAKARPAERVVVTPRDAGTIVPVASDAAPPVTREQALAQAHDVLRAQLSAPPRVQRVAASALTRTGDDKARDVLADALRTETSDLGKVELAYALARGGDPRGLDALVTAASSAKRESKHEAGRRLAMLGDKRAIKILESSLNYPQFKLGVAEQLAFLAEPRALAILDAVRANPKALPDEKSRAAIALGWAGRADIAPALHELLADDRNNAFAAPALANLHDEAARPVLEKQLAIPSLRVPAARALRRLAPDADVSALLPPLVAALTSNKDTDQVQIAETILLLAGPPGWSQYE
jgi:HEAT repeat protein